MDDATELRRDAESPDEPPPRPRIVIYAFLAVLVVVLILNFLVFRHFLVTVLLAASVAAMLGPVYDRLTRAIGGRRSLSAALMVVLTSVVIFLPLLSYAAILGSQAVDFFAQARPLLEPQALRQFWVETLPSRFPWAKDLKDLLQLSHLDQAALTEIVSPLLSQLLSGAHYLVQGLLSGLTSTALDLLLFLITLFFILRDGRHLGTELRAIAPVSPQQADEVYERLAKTVKGVLYAMVVVPVSQGVLAMIGFSVFGLPSPLFWGTTLIFAAIIPGIGSPLVWVPASVYLLLTGPLWQGIGLAIYGTLVISTSDNIIKPLLLRRTAQIHPLVAFFAILGGLLSFGVVGFLVGPVIVSLLLSVIRIYRVDILRVPEESN